MPFRFFSPSGARRHLSRGSTRFTTRRSAFALAIALAAASSAAALGAGVALGAKWAEQRAGLRAAAAARAVSEAAERAYVAGEVGKLNASIAQLEPRLDHLASHVDDLRDFQARLKAPQPMPGARNADPAPKAMDADAGESARTATNAHEAAGGPALPPLHCADSELDTHDADADIAPTRVASLRRRLDCMADSVGRLERQASAHTAAWTALPGRLPVAGARMGSAFGNRSDPFNRQLSFHSGIDLAASTGTPILSTAGGRVSFSGQKPGYGNVVEIDHGNALVTRYGHASRLVVREGDLVLPQQHIADVGSTGRSTGPHLHFEVLRNGRAIDPDDYLRLFDEEPRA